MPQPPSKPNEGFSAKPLAGAPPLANRNARPPAKPEANEQDATAGMPIWLIAIASLAVAFHLLGVFSAALAAPSGPWPSDEGGRAMERPPQFAASIREKMGPKYLQPLKMTHNYHFPSDNPV